jgi:arylsulfatase A
MGPFGGSIPTPAIDRLAQEGLVATGYYCLANICTPSRAGLLTGRSAPTSAMKAILYGDDRRLPLSEKTIASVLKPDLVNGLSANGILAIPVQLATDQLWIR